VAVPAAGGPGSHLWRKGGRRAARGRDRAGTRSQCASAIQGGGRRLQGKLLTAGGRGRIGPAEHRRDPCRWRGLRALSVAALAAGGVWPPQLYKRQNTGQSRCFDSSCGAPARSRAPTPPGVFTSTAHIYLNLNGNILSSTAEREQGPGRLGGAVGGPPSSVRGRAAWIRSRPFGPGPQSDRGRAGRGQSKDFANI
jgi:hypothetical protein